MIEKRVEIPGQLAFNLEPTSEPTAFKIEGVPLVGQRAGNWCGYASLSMVLGYWGYNDITPGKIFEYLHGDYKEEVEKRDGIRTPAPTIDTLASIVRELTPLETRIIEGKDYEKIKNMGTPPEILQKFIKGNIPCIVRTPGHFIVATGIDSEKNIYTFNDPLGRHGSEREIPTDRFEAMWDHVRPNYPRDTRHLMLVINRKR